MPPGMDPNAMAKMAESMQKNPDMMKNMSEMMKGARASLPVACACDCACDCACVSVSLGVYHAVCVGDNTVLHGDALRRYAGECDIATRSLIWCMVTLRGTQCIRTYVGMDPSMMSDLMSGKQPDQTKMAAMAENMAKNPEMMKNMTSMMKGVCQAHWYICISNVCSDTFPVSVHREKVDTESRHGAKVDTVRRMPSLRGALVSTIE